MSVSFPGLPPEPFARAFPFHVAFDERLQTVSTGEAEND
jgi:hypothetical protein